MITSPLSISSPSQSRSTGIHSPSVTQSMTVHTTSVSSTGALSPIVNKATVSPSVLSSSATPSSSTSPELAGQVFRVTSSTSLSSVTQTSSPVIPSSSTSPEMVGQAFRATSSGGGQTSLSPVTQTTPTATSPTAPPAPPPTTATAPTSEGRPVGSPANAPTTPVVAEQSNSRSSVHIVQSVTVVTPTSTSTATEFSVFTLSTPVAVTTVQDGTTSVGTPALVTVLSTSTDSNGSTITRTRVFANPTGVALAQPTSILRNTGAVAGIFVTVGVISACLLLGALYFIRRVHRKRRQDRWRRTLRSPHNDRDAEAKVPFHDHDSSGPVLRTMSLESSSAAGNSKMVYPAYDTAPVYLRKEPFRTGTDQKPRSWSAEPESPFSDIHAYNQIPAMVTDHLRSLPQARTSDSEDTDISPKSTPSIYPVTLPPMEFMESGNERVEKDEEPVEPPIERHEPMIQVSVDRPRTAGAPPRPPRSALRSLSRPSTAPSSSNSTPHNDIYTILQRQTLLDVRPRSSQVHSETSHFT